MTNTNTLDREDVRAALKNYLDAYGREAVGALIDRFGQVSALPENMFGVVIAACEAGPTAEMVGEKEQPQTIAEFSKQFWDRRKAEAAGKREGGEP